MENRQTNLVRGELLKQRKHWERIAARAGSQEELERVMQQEIIGCARSLPEGPCRTLLEDALEEVDWPKLAAEWMNTSTVGGEDLSLWVLGVFEGSTVYPPPVMTVRSARKELRELEGIPSGMTPELFMAEWNALQAKEASRKR